MADPGLTKIFTAKSREVLAEHFRDGPADERALITGVNAAALYKLN